MVMKLPLSSVKTGMIETDSTKQRVKHMNTKALLGTFSSLCLLSVTLSILPASAEAVPTPQAKFQLAQAETAPENGNPITQAQKWLGKNLSLAWKATKTGAHETETKFETLLCDARMMVWRAFDNDDGSPPATTTYTIQQISPTITQISWKEDPQRSNLAWVWTLDESTGKAYGVVVNSQPRENLPIEGEFTIQETITEAGAPEFQCPQ